MRKLKTERFGTLTLALGALALSCSSSNSKPATGGSGGSSATGGQSAASSTGGATGNASGGATSTGGATSAGGTTSTGGAAGNASGGTTSTGGAAGNASGGTTSIGGAAGNASGGTTSTGGATSAGGNAAASILSAGYTGGVCAVVAGDVKCWGEPTLMGVTTTACSGSPECVLPPSAVPGLTGVTAVSVGGEPACAITAGGVVQCWSTIASPTAVAGLTGVTAISVGRAFTCAITATGAAQCWGRNSNGQLGNGSMDDSSAPVQVMGLTSGVTAIAAGDSSACAVTGGGAVECWGANTAGQLGNGTFTDSAVPVQVSGITSGATAISVGIPSSGDTGIANTSACAITAGGAVQCWGANSLGQLGNDMTLKSAVPVTAIASGATAVSVGSAFACAIASSAVQCWGDADLGQLGESDNGCSTVSGSSLSGYAYCATPVFADMGDFVSVSVGTGYACAMTADGKVDCWGDNSAGQLGDTTTKKSDVPKTVAGL